MVSLSNNNFTNNNSHRIGQSTFTSWYVQAKDMLNVALVPPLEVTSNFFFLGGGGGYLIPLQLGEKARKVHTWEELSLTLVVIVEGSFT